MARILRKRLLKFIATGAKPTQEGWKGGWPRALREDTYRPRKTRQWPSNGRYSATATRPEYEPVERIPPREPTVSRAPAKKPNRPVYRRLLIRGKKAPFEDRTVEETTLNHVRTAFRTVQKKFPELQAIILPMFLERNTGTTRIHVLVSTQQTVRPTLITHTQVTEEGRKKIWDKIEKEMKLRPREFTPEAVTGLDGLEYRAEDFTVSDGYGGSVWTRESRLGPSAYPILIIAGHLNSRILEKLEREFQRA